MQDRRRNLLILLLVGGLIAASAAAIALKPTRLGLELKGGVSLVYKAEPTAEAQVTSETITQSIEIMRKRVDATGVAQPEIQSVGKDEINVALPNATNAKQAEEEVGKPAEMHFYDWETNVIGPNGHTEPEETSVTGGGNAGAAASGIPEYEAVLRAAKRKPILRHNDTTRGPGCTLAQNEAKPPVPNAECAYGQWFLLETKTKKVLHNGQPQENKHDLFSDFKAPKGAKLKVVRVNPGTIVVRARPEEEGEEGNVTKAEPESFYVLNDNPVISGADITNPAQSFENGGTGEPIVTFGFKNGAATTFEHVTKKIAERGEEKFGIGVTKAEAEQHFAIVLDGQLITVPRIDFTANPEGIDARNGSEISGGFTLASAQNLANELKSGALPIKLEEISHSQVSATLGKEALKEGVLAGLIGLAVVCLFLLIFYRFLGLIAIGGLIIYGVYVFALVKVIPITLTLPGIAGAILTIGVAADANIVIFERVKEEIRSGRSVVSGIAAGYKRGFAAIIDANVVTFMTAFILFALATAEVQGFAFMLGIGTLSSLFTAVLATQAALGVMAHTRAVTHPAMLGAGKKRRGWRFDFMGASRWFFSLSGMILLVGALAIGARGLNLGFDFTGGTEIHTALTRPASLGEVSSALTKAGIHNPQVQRESKKGHELFDIKIKKLGPKKVETVRTALNVKFGSEGKEAVRDFSDTAIGPTFGAAIANAAIIAIIASLLVISVYIALRFEWKYALPVLIALAHDLLITSGIYALTGREVTSATVAALLTILGYSMYDTIIVFDRIRENVPRMPRAAFSQIVNRSMSEVLTRSLATSFCTLLPVLSLLIFGGETLKSFAFALLVGIASGAYSSIFIASPVLTHWKEREPVYRNRRLRLLRDFGKVPAYATAAVAGAGTAGVRDEDVEPAKRRRSRGSGGLNVEEPGQQISKEEFDELVRDLDIEGDDGAGEQRRGAPGTAVAPRQGRGGRRATPATPGEASSPSSQQQAPGGAGQGAASSARGRFGIQRSTRPADQGAPDAKTSEQQTQPAADATPEDLVMKETGKRREKSRRPRNRRHGRSR
ncbi:MAG TPA: protein translocase subunit SecD [Solirubrobacteraceae bacterium]|jgi:SecD/SecF fusion protein